MKQAFTIPQVITTMFHAGCDEPDVCGYRVGKGILRRPQNEKAFIQCEFIHAMGNGPGDIHDYMELMYKYDKFWRRLRMGMV